MKPILFLLIAAAAVVLLILLISYLCFRMAFYAPRKASAPAEEYPIPAGAIYEPHRDTMVAWIRETRSLPKEEMTIRSFDGLTLRGIYYEYAPGAPIELMFHGYRGSAERDLCGGVQRCFALKRSALIVDQRCSGKSEGNVITFGIHERRDCLSWLEHMKKRFDPDVKIILTGISMGAATVLMAAGEELPDNVIGVLADCGYTSPKAIIQKVIWDMKLPVGIAYPFVRLAARIYGHFNLEEASPIAAMAKCKVPVIFYHGESDDLVPCQMSAENYNSCAAKKKLITIPGAGHGLCYIIDPDTYLQTLRDFFGPSASWQGET